MDIGMKAIIVAIVIFSTLSSGCSTFVPKTQTISAACSEPDAILQINGEVYPGVAQIEARRNRSFSVTCTKGGYFAARRTIDYSLSETGVADAVGTALFLVPGIGLLSPGAWKLDETDVRLSMIKDGK